MEEREPLSASGIERHLKNKGLRIEYCPVIGSTNTALKERAAAGESEGLVIVAGEQSAGRGRMGRRFYSPAGTGLYMSLLLRPECTAAECALLTPAAAVAAAEAFEAVTGRTVQIKWVNDVLLEGKKVCGILTEASLDASRGRADWAVVGVGVNVLAPAEGFPQEIRDTAGALFASKRAPVSRCAVAAAVLDALAERCRDPGSRDCYDFYVNHSSVPGRDVWLLSPGREREAATVLGIERDYALRVRMADGSVRRVSTGEVSLRLRLNPGPRRDVF